MNILIERLLKQIKSKPPLEWKGSELENFAYCIQFFYEYSDSDGEDRKELRKYYDKIVGIINNDKSFHTMINPGFLNQIDRNGK